MKPVALALCLSIIIVSCGGNSSGEEKDDTPVTLDQKCEAKCDSKNPGDQNSRGPEVKPNDGDKTSDSDKPSDGSQDTLKDTEAPRLTGFQQVGLTQFKFEFSEPIKRSSAYGTTPLFGNVQWSEDRRSLTVPFDVQFTREFTLNSFHLTSITDDAGNTQNLSLEIPIDTYAPVITSAQWLDEKTLEILFDEDIVLKGESRLTLSGKITARPEALQSIGKKLKFQVEGEALLQTTSYLLRLTGVSDVYGNSKDVTHGRYTYSADKTPPTITAFEQKPTEIIEGVPYFVFHLTYSEYVVDGRDADKSSGIFSELGDLLDSLQSFVLNGEDTFFFLTKWVPDADHQGATIKFRRYTDLKHGATNTFSMGLVDIAGNEGKASVEFVPDVQAPLLSGSSGCSMDGLTAFRCKISGTDVRTAVLKPESIWARDSYTFQVSEGKKDDKTQAWLRITFKDQVDDRTLQGIELIDTFGNTNKDAFNENLSFPISTKAPALIRVSAFGTRVLELSMDRPVSEISSIDVGSFTQVPFVLKKFSSQLVIEFAQDIPDGEYALKLFGVKSERNPAAVSHLSSDSISNRENTILSTTVKSIRNSNAMTFELSRELMSDLKVFARTLGDDRIPVDTLLGDITVVKEPMTTRGTFPIRLTKTSAQGLQPDSLAQHLVFQFGGQAPSSVFRVAWTTQAPEIKVDFASAATLLLTTSSGLVVDTSSLDLEIVDAEGNVSKVAVEPLPEGAIARAWYVPLPTDPALAPGAYTLRVNNARTKYFGIPMKEPQSMGFTIK